MRGLQLTDERILVTGLGALSCLGAGIVVHRQAFAQGRSGVRPVPDGHPRLPAGIRAGWVEFDIAEGDARVWQFLQYALCDALDDAGLPTAGDVPVFVGSVHGHLDGWLSERRGSRGASELWQPHYRNDPRLSSLRPPVIVSTACTASSVALGLAFDALHSGDHQIAIVVGAESLTGFLQAGFEALRAVSRERCRPFDRRRSGLVLGEGAAAVVLETETHARQRGASAIAEVAGYGFAADAAYLTAPDPSGAGAAAAMRQALSQAGLTTAPDFINAHGTGTRLNDHMECVALRQVFGAAVRSIAITSIKPLTGHLCGAAGVMEVLSSVLSLQSGTVPAIDGFDSPDPEFGGWDFVSRPRHISRMETAVSMNSGFGGTNTAIALRRVGVR